jgi:hypothetical protein
MKTTIDKSILAVAQFADKSDLRPALASVYIDNEKMVATDSYKLLEVKHTLRGEADNNAEGFPEIANVNRVRFLEKPVLIPAKDILKKLKLSTKQPLPVLNTALLCNETEKTIALATTDLETSNVLQLKKVEADFPKYETMFPPAENIGASVLMDAKVLIEALTAFIEAGTRSNVRISIQKTEEGGDSLRAIMLTGLVEGKTDNRRAIVMPLTK